MKSLVKFLDTIDTINERTGQVTSFLSIVLMLLIVYDVCLRYFFNNPTIWALETSCFLLLALAALGGGYTLLHGAHVKIDIIYQRFPPRVKAAVDIIAYLALFLIVVVLVWQGSKTAWVALIRGYTTDSMWRPPTWPSYMIIPIGAMLVGLQGLAKWIRDWFMAVAGVKLESKVVKGEGGIRG